MPWRASCRVQTRALTLGGGRRSSRANIIRRRTAGSTVRASLMVHRVGAGASSSSRFMNTFEPPPARNPRGPGESNCPKIPRPEKESDSRSSISSKRSSERRPRAIRRWASRSSCSLSLRLGSSPSSSDSPTLWRSTPSRPASTLQSSVLPVPGGPYRRTFTPGAPVSRAPPSNRSTWSRSCPRWSKSGHSSSPGDASPSSRRFTSSPGPPGMVARRCSRLTSVRSPSSLSMHTSPDRTRGASARRRPRIALADTPRRADSTGPLRLKGVLLKEWRSKTLSIIDSMMGCVW